MPTPTIPLRATADTALLDALRRNDIDATPRTVITWLETGANLCRALADYYRATEPQATRTADNLDEASGEFRFLTLT